MLLILVAGADYVDAVPMPTPRPHIPAPATMGAPPPPSYSQRPVPSLSASPPSTPRAFSDPSPVSDRDKALVKEALSLIARDQFGEALARQLAITHPLARGVVEFFYVRDRARDAGYRRIADFLAAYPDWPSRDLLRLRLAQDMMDENAPASEVLRLLGNDPPTGSGHIVVAAALAASGRTRDAQALARAAWYRDDLDPDQERWAMQRLGPLLTADDNRRRMDMYFYRDRTSDALRIAGYLGQGWKAYADARAAVIKRSGNAGKLLDAVPRAQRDEPGYIFAKIQYLRRADKELEAAALLAKAPKSRDALVDPDEWWVERRLAARSLLDDGRPADAYNIAAGHSAVDSGDYAEAEFHAGWIALRFLNDPRRAAAHFANIAGVATIPSTRARASYWLGRAAEASGDTNAAISHYRRAAADPSAFYGQLAAAKLSQRRLEIPRPPSPSASAARAFEAQAGVRAIRLLADIGYNSLAGPMLYDMADSSRSAEETVMIAALAADLGYTDMVVHAGKRGQANGYAVDRVAFPVNGVPKFKPLNESVEPALVHAISRQESLFNPRARSHADARGLMQLLPSTAAGVAKRNGVSYSKDKLYDPTYNAQLGAAYLSEGVARYNGSYILAIAAYNAGRGRADEWIERFGDPRSPKVDPIDWIERIPFTETREYVQKVLENLQFYRAILPGVDGTLSIANDLQRGS
ncbi:MAG: lytic transglycosylase domain-containing protein [Rhodobiaceae bacterium]|nr:lytic transglycosylase domain-containing protein [Rhodobiaceae bacterium]MCC0056458.1 lytic transglycosylase domain-containing protein [Rhodobiaceae bacterium]